MSQRSQIVLFFGNNDQIINICLKTSDPLVISLLSIQWMQWICIMYTFDWSTFSVSLWSTWNQHPSQTQVTQMHKSIPTADSSVTLSQLIPCDVSNLSLQLSVSVSVDPHPTTIQKKISFLVAITCPLFPKFSKTSGQTGELKHFEDTRVLTSVRNSLAEVVELELGQSCRKKLQHWVT